MSPSLATHSWISYSNIPSFLDPFPQLPSFFRLLLQNETSETPDVDKGLRGSGEKVCSSESSLNCRHSTQYLVQWNIYIRLIWRWESSWFCLRLWPTDSASHRGTTLETHAVSQQVRIKWNYCTTDPEKKEVTQVPPVKEKRQFSAIKQINFSVCQR